MGGTRRRVSDNGSQPGAKKKAKVEQSAVSELVTTVVSELDDDVEQEIIAYIRKDRSLGPKVLGMLKKQIFNLPQDAPVVEGDPDEILCPTTNKWDLIGNTRAQVILQRFNKDLGEQITDLWTKAECTEAMCFGMNVDVKSAIPNTRFGDCIEYAVHQYTANDEPLKELTLKDVLVGTGKKAIQKNIIDWDSMGPFKAVKEAGIITHRKEGVDAPLPKHMLEDKDFALVHNTSETKAMLRTQFNDTPVLRIFGLAKKEIRNRPLYVAHKIEARSASGSPGPKSKMAGSAASGSREPYKPASPGRRRLSKKTSNASSGEAPPGSGGAA